jgi:hypothetical protein
MAETLDDDAKKEISSTVFQFCVFLLRVYQGRFSDAFQHHSLAVDTWGWLESEYGEG